MKENNNECFEVAEKRYNELMDIIKLLEKRSDNEDDEQISQFFNKYLPLEMYNIFEVYIKSIVGNLIDIIEKRGIKKELISDKLLNKDLCRKFKKLLKSNEKAEDAVREYHLYYESLNERVVKIEKVKDFTLNDYKHKPSKLEEVLDMLLNKNNIFERIVILKNPSDKSSDEGINFKNYVGFNVVLDNFAKERNQIVHDHIEIEQNNERTLENVKELIQQIFDGLSQLNDIYLDYIKEIKFPTEIPYIAYKLIDDFEIDVNKIGEESLISKLEAIDIAKQAKNYDCSEILLTDIIEALKSPQIDVREELETATFDASITSIEEVKVGSKIKGQVRNIVDFGAFVDIGIKNDALIHISQLSDKYIKEVTEVINIGDIKDFIVTEVDIEKGRVQLSLKNI